MGAYGNDNHVGWFFSLGNGRTDAHLLVCQLTGLIFIVAWTFIIMLPFFVFLNVMGWFRSESVQELVGLDLSYHGRSMAELTNDQGVEDAEDPNDGNRVQDAYIDAYERYRISQQQKRHGGSRGGGEAG